MHSHYGIQATSHAKVQLSVHERIGDLHKRASGMAPAVEESAADSGCTDWSRRKHRGMGPRQRMAWDMVAEALGWNAISDKPAMLAAAEQCERDGQPYYVGYAHNKPAEFTTALATETDAFTFGVWGHDQPLEVLPADDARELADTNALIDEISERHGLSTEPAEELTSANAQPCPSMHPGFPGLTCNLADGHSADHYALGYTWPNLRPVHEAMAEAQPTGLTAQLVLTCCGTEVNYPQAGGETACTVCHTTFTVTAACPDDLVSCENCSAPCDGTLTAYSELFDEDMPVCPQCHGMLRLMDALSDDSGCACRLGPDCPTPEQCSAAAIAAGERRTCGIGACDSAPEPDDVFCGPCKAAIYQPRHAGREGDTPSRYTGTRRATTFAEGVAAQMEALRNGLLVAVRL